jgi:hypothetical protein
MVDKLNFEGIGSPVAIVKIKGKKQKDFLTLCLSERDILTGFNELSLDEHRFPAEAEFQVTVNTDKTHMASYVADVMLQNVVNPIG